MQQHSKPQIWYAILIDTGIITVFYFDPNWARKHLKPMLI